MNKYHLVHIAIKGASWVLRAEELEAEKREGTYTKSSFVSLEVEGATTPSFGRVQHFFQHSFAGQCHDFAVVNLYGRPRQDARSRLWYVPTITAKTAKTAPRPLAASAQNARQALSTVMYPPNGSNTQLYPKEGTITKTRSRQASKPVIRLDL